MEKRETLAKYKDSPYLELQRKVYPHNPDKDGYIRLMRLSAGTEDKEDLISDLDRAISPD